MPTRLLNSPAAIPIAAIAILLGLAFLLVAGVTGVVQSFRFMQSGDYISVPTEPITLNVEPNTRYAVFHQMTGAHITVNQPLKDIPETLNITITETSSGQPIELNTSNWMLHSSFFGLESRRRALSDFTAPESGQITLAISGIKEPTVFYLGRPQSVFETQYIPKLLGVLIVAIGVILAASVVIIRRLAQAAALTDLNIRV